MSETHERLVEQIASLARQRGLSVATAESLTTGRVAAQLGAAPEAAEWFRGGLVAYHDEVKHELLGVPRGPVVSDPAVRQMARGAARLLGADVAVATTGAGGPSEQDGQPPGTVFVAVVRAGEVTCREFHFEGEPPEVVARTTAAALELVHAALG